MEVGAISIFLEIDKTLSKAFELFSRTWYGEMERYRFSKNP